jgi:hypothetical protein
MPNFIEPDSELEAELNELSRDRIQELRDRWRAIFRADPPKAFGPDLLRRSIAYRLQERRYGGLPTSAQRQLNSLIKVLTKKRIGHIELPKRVKSGAVLVRLWKGSHRVTVLDDGFAFEGRIYKSLSEIAREITSTRWNGPRFFRLRPGKSSEEAKDPRLLRISGSDLEAAVLVALRQKWELLFPQDASDDRELIDKLVARVEVGRGNLRLFLKQSEGLPRSTFGPGELRNAALHNFG